MAKWYACKAIVTLRDQVNKAYPNRSKISDGVVGDLAHRKRKSDHNPDSDGAVRAIDLTHSPKQGFNSWSFADHLRAARDSRISYVISNRRIFSSSNWAWRKYTGLNAHSGHVHISIKRGPHNDARPWAMPGAAPRAAGAAVSPPEEPGEDFDPNDVEAYGHIITEDDGDVVISDATEGWDGEGEDETGTVEDD